ncbi:hypothetical protein M422DRAFT_260242 [Sphaerobolus stellatus SS14]|uniref:Uncharacterized protein n=1 Tax=Sphaerobolus stellatus (strain SS14) TaxID=990650 RepID=A0A0C9VJ01_SPHS4|nr:hypothetical protein M422DRAFT_260242 [Sphaerobolus stellatus SS14]
MNGMCTIYNLLVVLFEHSPGLQELHITALVTLTNPGECSLLNLNSLNLNSKTPNNAQS